MTHATQQAALSRVGTAGCLLRYGLLSLVFAAATALVFGWYGHRQAALVAGGICWLGASAGFWLLAGSRSPQGAAVALAGAVLARTLLPLIAALVVESKFPELRSQGFMGQVVVIYLAGLAAETALIVPLIQRRQADPSGSAAGRSEHG